MDTYSIKQLRADFPNDNACLSYVFDQKYGKDFLCPKCAKTGFYKVTNRKCWACSWCGYQIHPLRGTIFAKSSTPLTLWFHALFLFSASKNGVSAKELERQLGVTYKTAWRIAKEIRKLMEQKSTPTKGIFEADETYIGGHANMRNKHKNKTPVVGVVKRQGGVFAKATEDIGRSSVMPIIKQNVRVGSRLITDEAPVYNYAKREYRHNTIKHSKKEYVRGTTHTNTIEGFWSQVKRSFDGTYHAVSPKYLQAYLDEFAFRYNHRWQPVFPVLLARLVK